MSIFDFFLSRNNVSTINDYIGHEGRLFYDSATGEIRISDGVTPGGLPIPITVATTSTAGSIKPGPGFAISNTGTLLLNAGPSFYLDENDVFRLRPGSADLIGGIKSGPGLVIDSEGTLFIDTSGLPFTFGDFTGLVGTYSNGVEYAQLSSVKADEDIVIASNGTGTVFVVGSFQVHKTNGTVTGSLKDDPVLAISADGDISARSLDIQETSDLGLMAALNVTINEQGLTKTPAVVTGSVAQFTGRDNRTAILVLDTYGTDTTTTLTGGEFTFRTGRGTNSTTTSVLSGDRLGQVAAAGWASNGYGGIAVGGLRILANENYTATARGSRLELFATPNGTLSPSTIATVNSTGLTMASGKVITQTVRNAGSVGGTTVTLDWATDSMVHCTFSDNFTVAFSNYTAGRTITLIATNTSGFDTDIITAGISAANMQGDNTLTVTEQTTAIITYYCTGNTVGDVFASAVYQ